MDIRADTYVEVRNFVSRDQMLQRSCALEETFPVAVVEMIREKLKIVPDKTKLCPSIDERAEALAKSIISPPSSSPVDAPLNGKWSLSNIFCENGKVTKNGQTVNEALKSGSLIRKYKVEKDGSVFGRMNHDGCIYEIREHWEVKKPSITISKTEAKVIDQGPQRRACKGYANSKSRNYGIETIDYYEGADASLLRIKLDQNNEVYFNGAFPVLCEKGKTIIVLIRP